MSGNVMEVTASCYFGTYRGWASTSRWLAESKRDCSEVAARGGNFALPMDAVRVALRDSVPQDHHLQWSGFRVVKNLRFPQENAQ